RANLLAIYRDKPKQWDAWNIDNGYQSSRRFLRAGKANVEDGALIVPFEIEGDSLARMRISLLDGEPFLRVDVDVDWEVRHRLLRVENWVPLNVASVTYGTPHGTIARSFANDTPELRAKYEVPGQRFALVSEPGKDGFAILALDTYGWSARALREGGIQLGHSLLRSPAWPDPDADRGTHRISYAFAPVESSSVGTVERAWQQFAHDPRVKLFINNDRALLVTACKPAEDGDGVIVRVRECDGVSRIAAMRCAARITSVESVDALERSLSDARVEIAGESLQFDIGAFGLRSFRVRF
ncbi:MAG: hypothetical protein JO165_02130, partial [Candidatus Eremiobacteraeota bacterium]|nr:hypothetical protein [Candidatus Eremiobacteraeota bacterium]